MTAQFLTDILIKKKEEVDKLPEESLKPLRKAPKFYDFVRNHNEHLQIISEVKRASPSLGDINTEIDCVKQARQYEKSGAAMISVLTDHSFFKGDISDLKAIADVVHLPILNKDFIIDEKQIIRARNNGATVILLIVAALDLSRLKVLFNYAHSLGLEVLVETHNRKELEIAHEIGAKIIGVNNRNLTTFEVSTQTSLSLVNDFKKEAIYISESGIKGSIEAEQMAPYFDALLVGTTLMTAQNVERKLKELQVDKG